MARSHRRREVTATLIGTTTANRKGRLPAGPLPESLCIYSLATKLMIEIPERIRDQFRDLQAGCYELLQPARRSVAWEPVWRAASDKTAAFARAFAGQPAVRLLCFLLLIDALFIVLHLLYGQSGLLADPAFRLDWEQGYPEIFQYAKMTGIVIMLAALTRQRRSPVYFHWLLLFLYLLLDDAFMIHETAGGLLANEPALPSLAGAHPQDVGELLVYAFAGFFFLTTLTFTYQRSDRPARELSQYLFLLMLALGFFSVILDLAQHQVSNSLLFQLIGILEDGGEHVVISIIAAFLFFRLAPLLGWQARAGAWVRTLAQATTLFVLFLLALTFVQFGAAGLAGNDGYYHARMGQLMRQQGLKPEPPQLPLTILNESAFYDHHLLYHAYLALFAADDPVEDGGQSLTHRAKEASVLMATMALVAIWWLLRQQGVAWPWLWALAALAASEAFLYRMSMPRAQSASLLVLTLGLHWLLQKRYRLLLPLGFVYVWLYNAFPLLLVVAGVYFAAIVLAERRLAWPALTYPAAGILLGIVINPYFPDNVAFMVDHLGPKIWFSDTLVGNEWYPYETWTLVQNSAVALAAYWLGLLALGWRRERIDSRTLTLFLLTAVLGLMLLKSRRFIEYFPPFALIFTAFSVSPLLQAWQQQRPRLHRLLPLALALLLLPLLFSNLRAARDFMGGSDPPDQYAAATLWLKAYSQPGSVIFQTDWDDFPRLFFYDSRQIYTVGLDPTYMENHDPDLFQTWVQITRGQVDAPGTVIAGRFNADYVFSDLDHGDFLRQAATDPYLTEIYRDNYAVIFSVEPGQ